LVKGEKLEVRGERPEVGSWRRERRGIRISLRSKRRVEANHVAPDTASPEYHSGLGRIRIV
jgi:hypothetical protein